MTSAKAWGIDARLVTPAEIKELVPFINEEILLGGFYTPSVSCVDSLETGTQMRDEAVDNGALQVFANTEVLDIETEDGPGGPKVTAVVTDKGRIEAEYVVDRLRRVEPAHRQDGRRQHPAHARRAPDGRRRPDRHPAAERQGGRLPDRPRHGHVLLRAPVGRLDGGRQLRPPADLHAPRRHPVATRRRH